MSVLFISVALASGTKPETGLMHGKGCVSEGMERTEAG